MDEAGTLIHDSFTRAISNLRSVKGQISSRLIPMIASTALCVVECPVEAIDADCDVVQDQKLFIALNLELARRWKPIIETKAALPDADEWAKVRNKLHLLV